MGQAKRRGTFEERLAQAVARKSEIVRPQMAIAQNIQKPVTPRRSSIASMAALTALLSLGSWKR